MKKVISVKEIVIVMISVLLIACTTEVFALNPSVGNNSNEPTVIQGNQYNEFDNAQNIPNNTVNNNINNSSNNNTNNNANNNANNNTNNTKVYNTNNKNNADLPQTGIEDYNIGILLIICIVSAMYAFRKINDYRSI